MTENVIEVRGLRTQFGSHVIHDGLDLDLKRGQNGEVRIGTLKVGEK